MIGTDIALPVVNDPTEVEVLNTFPLSEDGAPYISRIRDPLLGNVVCGKCLRVVGKGVSLLDFWVGECIPAGLRQLLKCSCGSYLHVPAHEGEHLPLRQAIKMGRRPRPE